MLRTILIFCALSIAYGYDNCPDISDLITPNEISVSNCKDGETCVLKRKHSVHINITFDATEDVKCVQTELHGVIMGRAVPYPFDPSNCADSLITCSQDKSCRYQAEMYVQKFYPPITLTVQWALKDSNDKHLVCILIPAKIR